MRSNTTTPSAKWVTDKVVTILQTTPNMGTNDLQTRLEGDWKCTIGYDTVWKGREKVMAHLYGSWEESFGQLYNWKADVMRKMSNSVIEIDIELKDDMPYFRRFFCALRPCIDGFLEGCRPYLSIDSTALNGRWKGHLVAVCSVDGHNWMYPIAYGFIDSETKDNWTWYMTQLHKALGDMSLLIVCTDACKGLEEAVKLVFPMAEQRECFKHLIDNYVKKYKGVEHMYPAGRAYRKDVHDYHMNHVDAIPETKLYWDTYHSLKWYRSGYISTSNSRQVIKAYLHECSCEEWQHTGKPCQHGLALITQQPIRDVRMEDFVNEYYSVERFRNAYKRLIEPLPDKKQWPKVDISSFIGAPLHKRGVGR
jgi:hypothetical protein